MHTTPTFILLLLANTTLAQIPILVKDINPGVFSGVYTTSNAAVIGNTLYFNAVGTIQDDELWKTDGTSTSTVLAKDINTGSGTSFQKFYTVFNDQLYLSAQTPALGNEFWSTDPDEGAVLVAGDACLGTCSGASGGSFIEYNGGLYFKLETADSGTELWVTDGSLSGAMLFKDIHPGLGSSYPSSFAVFNGKLYFAADSANVGAELWVSDGTSAGTHLLKDINTNPYQGSEMDVPVVGLDAFYFWAKNNSSSGAELWISDGTNAGTFQLKEIGPGSASGQPPYVPLSNSVWLGDKLLFTANDGVTGAELWITDGTESGTQLLLDINTGSAGSNLNFLTTWKGKAYFRAKTVTNGNEIWVSDGTVAGTQILKDINPGTGDGVSPIVSSPFVALNFIVSNDKLYFSANDGTTGYELWVTDGSSSGTKLVYDLNPGSNDSTPSTFRLMGNYIYFFATTQTNGTELWKFPLSTSTTFEFDNKLDIAVYPTFSLEGIFYYSYSGDLVQSFDIQVFDAFGKLVYHSEQSTIQPLQLSTLPSGAYYVRIATVEGKFTVQKVIIGR